MTEYLSLIQRAVEGLAKNNTEARRALYDRARAALVTQLHSVTPALSGAEITKERLSLEEAIHKVESEATRKALSGPRSDQRGAPSLPRPYTPERSGAATALRRRPTPANDSPLPERAPPQRAPEPQRQDPVAPVKQTARSRILGARTGALKADALKGNRTFGEVDDRGAAAAKTAPGGRDGAVPTRARPPRVEDPRAAGTVDDPGERPLDEPDGFEDHGLEDRRAALLSRNARARPAHDAEMDEADDEEEYGEPPPLRSYGQLARIAVAVIVAAAVAATAWQYRDSVSKVYHYVAQLRSPPGNQAARTTAPPHKFAGRVPQEPAPGQAAATGAAAPNQPPPQGVERAVLLEQDPNDPQGKHFDGTVTWRTETVSPGPGLAPELEVHGDITIPARHMTVSLSLRRNTDKALPASHTIQIMFNLPPDFPGEGVSSMPGIFAKDSEQATGTPLAGISVKVTDNYFLLGLSAVPAQQQRNVELLKHRKWFDIAIVYKNNVKAILAVERGAPGDRAFADAFSAWSE